MRIRFVTRDQLQVLQASRMEKHTIPDGTIPLYGLSPSAVSKQWGSQQSGNNWQVYYPMVFNSAVYGVWVNDYAAKNNNLQYAGVGESESGLNGFKMYTSTSNSMGITSWAIGR